MHAHYEAMWESAHGDIAAGDIDIDVLLDRLAQAEPQQYRHPPADMHLTILSLFTATDDPAAELARLDAYRAAVHAALEGVQACEIDFEGITLSRGAVMARGYPRGPALQDLRERLRAELRARGLDVSLDGRYRLVAFSK